MMDRFSSLPDEVLCHILSFLPTKYAALTSILSKRWLNLWKLVPNLDIDDTEFLHPEEDKAERVEIKQSFVDFVDGILAIQGDSPIEKFTLKCTSGINLDRVNRWICNVLGHGLSELDLFIDGDYKDTEEDEDEDEDEYHMCVDIFVSKTLVKLKIKSEHSVIRWYGNMYKSLPMLKSLCIDSDFICFGEIDTFLPYYTELEELRMANMEWRDLDVTISSSSLRKLSINGTGCEDMENPKSFSFDTPNLHYLEYSDVVAEDYPLVNMQKLLEAVISLIVTNDHIKRIRAPNNEDDGEGNVVLTFGNVVKLMNGIRNVRKLSLRSDTLEVLSMCCDSLPVFNNLIILGITGDKDQGWQGLPALLRKCPKLETIIFEGLLHHVTDSCGDACNCISREDKGRSLKSCPVKMIEIKGFQATAMSAREMRLIKHFLDYLPCLKLMKVYIEEDDPTQLDNPEDANIVIDMLRPKTREMTEMLRLRNDMLRLRNRMLRLLNCRKTQIYKLVLEYIDLYKKVSSCDVQLLVSDHLNKKWREEGIW